MPYYHCRCNTKCSIVQWTQILEPRLQVHKNMIWCARSTIWALYIVYKQPLSTPRCLPVPTGKAPAQVPEYSIAITL